MIYLVSSQQDLFESEIYIKLSVEDSIKMISSWDVIQFDTETSGRDPHICKILSLQFGNKKTNSQIVVDASNVDILQYKQILESGKLIIGQNLKFDLQFLYKYNIVPTNVWDTMIIEQFLHLGYDNKYFHYSLKAIGERRLGIDIDKSTRGEIIWRGLDSKVIQYAANDVVYLEDIKEQQEKEVLAQNGKLGAQIENNFVPVISYLEWCGIKLDENKWKLKIQDNEFKRIKALKTLNKFCVDYCLSHEGFINQEVWCTISEDNNGFVTLIPINKKYKNYIKTNEFRTFQDEFSVIKQQKLVLKISFIETPLMQDLFSENNLEPQCCINWSSSVQVIPFVKYLGFDVITTDKKTGESKESVVEKQLTKQKGINDEFLKLYFAYQEATKECSTYGQNYLNAINPITGRIHTQFKQIGAISGRMSCGSRQSNTDLAKLKGIPPNTCGYPQIQNLPSDEITRGAFIPNNGNLMTACDYAALESRLGADIYQDEAMLKEYLKGSGDIHSLVAKACFPKELEGIPVSEIKSKRPDLRKKAKAPEFACQFGGGAKAISESLGIPKEEAEVIYNNYLDGFKGITKFKTIGSEFVRTHGYVQICKKTGHRLYWEDFKKWREIEDLPEYIYKSEYTTDERREHQLAAAKWDRMSLNSPTQGTGIICLKLAMYLFFQWILQENLFNKVLICNLVHDESVIEYPKELVNIVPDKLKYCMEKAASFICTSLPIPAVPETGDHWIH